MKRETIIAFVGAIVDLSQVSKAEKPKFYFEAEEALAGTFEFKLWTTDKKTTPITITENPLNKSDNLLTLTFDATLWQLDGNSYYYEISKTQDKRIFFKGNVEVIQ